MHKRGPVSATRLYGARRASWIEARHTYIPGLSKERVLLIRRGVGVYHGGCEPTDCRNLVDVGTDVPLEADIL